MLLKSHVPAPKKTTPTARHPSAPGILDHVWESGDDNDMAEHGASNGCLNGFHPDPTSVG